MEETRIALKELHLHAPLFLGGRNFGQKIDAVKNQNYAVAIVHYICGQRNEIHVSYNGQYSYFPFIGNVANAFPFDHVQANIEPLTPKTVHPAPAFPEKIQAQGSVPPGMILGR